jgi:hypothetical protein
MVMLKMALARKKAIKTPQIGSSTEGVGRPPRVAAVVTR